MPCPRIMGAGGCWPCGRRSRMDCGLSWGILVARHSQRSSNRIARDPGESFMPLKCWSLVRVIALVIAASLIGAASGQINRLESRVGPLISQTLCNTAGAACCAPDAVVKTEHCHKGLGCDITTNTCRACGGPGQPCCDGHLTGFSLRGFTGVPADPAEKVESCGRQGASCDARLAPDGRTWVGTRKCIACGTREGSACCPPDVRYALGRCGKDSGTGVNLTCSDPSAGSAGTCVRCGMHDGDRACMEGRACIAGLKEVNGVCRPCGLAGQPTCDEGTPCFGSAIPDPSSPSRATCVAAGNVNEWCGPGRFCAYQDLVCNSRNRCERCGTFGQACCAPTASTPACEGNTPCTSGRCLTKPERVLCDEYAWKAVDQSAEWFDRGCGQPNDRWQTSYQNHFNWCMSVGSAVAARETSRRAGPLSQCSTNSPRRSEQPRRVAGEQCLVSAIVTVDVCYNADGTESQYRPAGSTRAIGCGSDADRATERAKAATRFPLSDDPTPGMCTFSVERAPGCLCN